MLTVTEELSRVEGWVAVHVAELHEALERGDEPGAARARQRLEAVREYVRDLLRGAA